MNLQHAPVTTALLGGIVVSSTFAAPALVALHTGGAGIGLWLPAVLRTALRLPLSCFPIMPYASTGWTFVCLLVLVFHCRTLERLWGSSRFLTFVMLTSVIGRMAAHLVTPSSEISRVLSMSNMFLPVAALVTRYCLDVPTFGATRLFGRVQLTESAVVVALAVKVLVLPFIPSAASELPASLLTALRSSPDAVSAVTFAAGQVLWKRLLLVAAGAALATVLSARKQRWLYATLCKSVSTPLVHGVLQPLLQPICGTPTLLEHHAPPQQQQQVRRVGAGAAGAAAGGAVASLEGDDTDDIPPHVWEQILREQHAQVATSPTQGNGARTFPVPTDAPSSRRGQPPMTSTLHQRRHNVDPNLVKVIKELQLGVSDEEIAQALVVCNNDVEMAAAFLTESHH